MLPIKDFSQLVLHRAAAMVGLQGIYLGDDRVLVRLPGRLHLYAAASDLSITPELVTQGMYDWPFWRFIHRVLRPGDRAVDVGANIGLFTVAMAARVGPTGRVIAYEPGGRSLELLRDNVISNWVGAQVDIVPVAAGSKAGEITFASNIRYLGSSSAGMTSPAGHAVRSGYVEEMVPVERLDARVHDRARLIKIDVEGGECSVLAGAGQVTADFWDVEVFLDMAQDRGQYVDALRALPGIPHVLKNNGTLQSIPFEHAVSGERFTHVIFADPKVAHDAGLT